MQAGLTETLWLDEHHRLSLSELAEMSHLSMRELHELMEYEIIAPLDPQAGQISFSANCLVTVKTAHRLRHDFELEAQGLALAMTLIERVRELETRLRDLDARLPRRTI